MRPSPDYKKLFSFILLAVFFVVPTFFSHAQTAIELKNKINQKSSEIDKLEQQIKQYQSQLESLGKQKSSLAVSIQELDLTKKKLNADISVTQNKIDQTNYKIQSLGSQIGGKQDSIDNATLAIAIDIRKTNEFEQPSLVETLLSNEDFTIVWNDIDGMITVREKIRDNITALRQIKGELEDTRKETIDAKNQLATFKSELADQKKIIEQNTNEKNKLLAQTKNSEANYQKLVASQTAQKNALEQELSNYESQLKFILDPKSIPSGRVLSWPLDSIYVTSPFGYRPAPLGYHNGTDFRAAVGTPAKAMADGVVLGTGNTDITCPRASFGQWVFIEYSNGLSSTYGHLSLIKAKVGDRVTRGEIVAYTGNTGYSTGPHLHVSVYVSKDADGKSGVSVQTIPSKSCLGKTLTQPIAATNAYLDPMKYLPSYP